MKLLILFSLRCRMDDGSDAAKQPNIRGVEAGDYRLIINEQAKCTFDIQRRELDGLGEVAWQSYRVLDIVAARVMGRAVMQNAQRGRTDGDRRIIELGEVEIILRNTEHGVESLGDPQVG